MNAPTKNYWENIALTLRSVDEKWEDWDKAISNEEGEEREDELDLELNEISVIQMRCDARRINACTYFKYKIWKELSLIAERTGTTEDLEEWPQHWNVTKDGIGVLK